MSLVYLVVANADRGNTFPSAAWKNSLTALGIYSMYIEEQPAATADYIHRGAVKVKQEENQTKSNK